MSLFRPAPLKPLDKVALIAPSSPVSPEDLLISEESVRFLGLRPVVFESCHKLHGYMAGEDKLRAKDIMDAFSDPEIKGIFCLKGGYGSLRLLPLLDFSIIRRNPKCFLGYSDITGLLTAIMKLCGFITYHAPMPTTDYTVKDQYTLDFLKRCIFSDKPFGRVSNPDGFKFRTLQDGLARGELAGGNLSLLASSLGSKYEINTKGKILFIEEVDRRPFDVDMYMTALLLSGKLSDASGIIIGQFERCTEYEAFPSLTIDDIIKEIILPLNKPVLSGLHAGHIYPQPSLPLGMDVILDTSKEYLEFI